MKGQTDSNHYFVSHAHAHLKPCNILVTEVDGKPMPRIIDFGLAKAMSPQPTDGTMNNAGGHPLPFVNPTQGDEKRLLFSNYSP
jgi:serine/threonine protein kinase